MEKKNFKLEINPSTVVNFNVVKASGKEEMKEWFESLVPEFSKNAETSWDIRKKEPINIIKNEYPATGDLEFNICIDIDQIKINTEDENNIKNYIIFKLSLELAITILTQYLSEEDKNTKLSELQKKSVGGNNVPVSDSISTIQIGIFQKFMENL